MTQRVKAPSDNGGSLGHPASPCSVPVTSTGNSTGVSPGEACLPLSAHLSGVELESRRLTLGDQIARGGDLVGGPAPQALGGSWEPQEVAVPPGGVRLPEDKANGEGSGAEWWRRRDAQASDKPSLKTAFALLWNFQLPYADVPVLFKLND